VALIVRYLKPPTLLIDLDPDLSLADMLGADFRKEEKRTVSEALYDVIETRKRGKGSVSITTQELMNLCCGAIACMKMSALTLSPWGQSSPKGVIVLLMSYLGKVSPS